MKREGLALTAGSNGSAEARREWRRSAVHALLAFLILVPVTLPVAGLRDLVQAHFEVSDTATSLFMVVNMVSAFFFAPVAGALVDRWGGRRICIVVALVVDGLAFLLLARERTSFPTFLALRAVEGMAHIAALSILMAVAADHLSELRRGRGMGLVAAALTFGVAVGAPLGAVLGRDDPWRPLQAASWIALATALLAALTVQEAPTRRKRSTWAELVQAISKSRAMVVPLLYAFVDRFTVGFFTTTFPLYMRNEVGVDRTRIGLLLALFLVPFSLLSYPSGRLSTRVSPARMVAVGSLVYGVLVASLGGWSADGLVLLMPLLGIFAAVMYVPSLLLLIEVGSANARATCMAAFHAAGSLGFVLGPIVGGLIVDASSDRRAGYAAAFVVAGASQVLCVLVTLPALRRLGRS